MITESDAQWLERNWGTISVTRVGGIWTATVRWGRSLKEHQRRRSHHDLATAVRVALRAAQRLSP